MPTGPAPLDAPSAGTPPEAGAALRRSEAALRVVLCGALLGAAAASPDPLGRLALALCAAATLAGAAPRLVSATTLAAVLWLPPAEVGWLGFGLLVALAAVRGTLHLGPVGAWLRRVRRLEWTRARALAATGLAQSDADADPEAAGDAYERDGRARSQLRALGAEPSPALAPIRPAARSAGRLLSRTPKVHRWLQRRLA